MCRGDPHPYGPIVQLSKQFKVEITEDAIALASPLNKFGEHSVQIYIDPDYHKAPSKYGFALLDHIAVFTCFKRFECVECGGTPALVCSVKYGWTYVRVFGGTGSALENCSATYSVTYLGGVSRLVYTH